VKGLAAVVALLIAAFAPAQTERRIEKSEVIDAPVAKVWAAWTTAEGLESFFCEHATVQLRANGKYELEMNPKAPVGQRGSEGCRILSYLPERMLSFTWNAPPSQPTMRLRRTFVVLMFTPLEGGKTKLELTHSGWRKGPEWDETYAYFDSAWGHVLASCQKRFQGPPPAATPYVAEKNAVRDDSALKEMAKMIGGTWRGEVPGPDGKPFVIEFKYRRHPDGVGVIGEGLIGKGRKDAVHVHTRFGWDSETNSAYYLDCHDSGTVYYGHIVVEKGDLVFVFGPAGGDSGVFYSRIHPLGPNESQNVIRDSGGKDLDAFKMVRH